MKTIKLLIPIVLLVWLSGCSTLSVNYDYNEKTDFQTYRTFDWQPFPENINKDTLNRDRFVNAVNLDLNAKGFTQSTTGADFLIATHFGKQDQVQVTDWGYSYAPVNHYRGYGYLHPGLASYPGALSTHNRVSVYEYEEGTLILDFIAADTKTLIWRATAKAVVNPESSPEKQTEKINNAVNEILKDFPPQAPE